MSVLALVPVRSGSKGIKNKNFRELGGKPLWRLALDCADAAGCDLLRITSGWDTEFWNVADLTGRYDIIRRPDELCSDTAAMVDVVKHALSEIKGPPDQIVLLLQPTAPFRTPAHLQQAIALLQESGADSVVSVVELPRTHAPEFTLCVGMDGRLERSRPLATAYGYNLAGLPTRRQAVAPAYIRDGTVYCVRRKTVAGGDLYGQHVRPLIIDPADSCELDTEADWAAVERRWAERHG